jgi:RNA polymerase sigma-70 factor (ECF subfamily)
VSPSSFYARGQSAYPGLELDAPRFEAYIAACHAKVPDRDLSPDDLCIEDLYLACACVYKVQNAPEIFARTYSLVIRTAVDRISPSATFQDEVEQRLLEQLLMGRDDRPKKIGDYTGYGALARWVSVVAQREALMLLRSDAGEARARDGAALEVLTASAGPEVAFAKTHYRPEFEKALADALRNLSPRERMVLHLHLLGGAGVVKIGKMYGVSPSTVSRWLAGIRETLSSEVRRLLSERLHLPPEEIESLTALLISQLDVSISRMLA